jgi:hypothetical protein
MADETHSFNPEERCTTVFTAIKFLPKDFKLFSEIRALDFLL